MFCFRTYAVLSACIVSLLSGGCRPQGEITQYTIPKPETIQLAAPGATSGGTESTAGRPERMLGALVPHRDQVWFFKLTGPVEKAGTHTESFAELVKSLKFTAAGKPEWQLPTGWSEQPGSGMRFSTLLTNDQPPLELTVIALPGGGADLAEQTLANVNRWRGQLSLPPISLAKLGEETTVVPTADGSSATLVDFTGTSSGGGMMNAPFARGGGLGAPSGLSAGGTREPATSAAAPLKSTAPAGWKEGRVGGMRKAAFDIQDGDQKAEVTVIDLPVEAGDRLANVNRWRGQVGLKELTAAELAESLTKVPVGDLEGDYVELVGEPSASQPQTILGAIVDHGGKAWFIKLQGDRELAAKQIENFKSFVKSITFGD